MGVGTRTLYVIRVEPDDENLHVSECYPTKKNGDWCRPKGTPIGYEMFIPNIWPWLKFEDYPVEVRVVDSYKETGLYLVAIDDYFGNELHLYNTKPILSVNSFGNYRYLEDETDPMSWSIHVSPACYSDLKSYQEVRNATLIPVGWKTEFTFSVSKKDLPDGIGEVDCRNVVIRSVEENFQRYLITAYAKSEESILKQWPEAYQIESRELKE